MAKTQALETQMKIAYLRSSPFRDGEGWREQTVTDVDWANTHTAFVSCSMQNETNLDRSTLQLLAAPLALSMALVLRGGWYHTLVDMGAQFIYLLPRSPGPILQTRPILDILDNTHGWEIFKVHACWTEQSYNTRNSQGARDQIVPSETLIIL